MYHSGYPTIAFLRSFISFLHLFYASTGPNVRWALGRKRRRGCQLQRDGDDDDGSVAAWV